LDGDTVVWKPKPSENEVHGGDTILFNTIHEQFVLIFQNESPFVKQVLGPPYIYVSDRETSSLTVRTDIQDLPRVFPFRCGVVQGGVLKGLDKGGDEMHVGKKAAR
jgi:hypothetical protein